MIIEDRNQWRNQEMWETQGISSFFFSGPRYTRKLDFAKECAGDVLGQNSNLTAHPDFTFISVKADDGSILPVKEFRGILDRLHTPPAKAAHRVVIIDSADLLNTQSQNALLKHIEEPRVPTVFFFVGDSFQSLLQTIQSRIIHVPLTFISHPFWEDGVQEFFNKQTDELKQFLEGRPNLAREMMSSKREFGKIEKRVASMQQLLDSSLGIAGAEAKKIAKAYDAKSLTLFLEDLLLVAHRRNVAPAVQRAIADSLAQCPRHLNKTMLLDHIVITQYAN